MKKNKLILVALIATSSIITSCSTEKDNTDKEYNTTTPSSTNQLPNTGLDSAIANPSLQQQNTNANPNVTPATNAATTTNSVNPYKDAKGKNPEHGKPGHRCDIPPGAPLNSPPGTNPNADGKAVSQPKATATKPVSTQPNVTTQAQAVSPTPTAPPKPAPQKTDPAFVGKANPDHGKPGHRCDLPVGSILPE